MYVPTSEIHVFKESWTSPHQITRLGMARTFQNIRLFKDLTVFDNIRIAFHYQAQYNLASAILRLPTFRREEQSISEKTNALLEIFGLYDHRHEIASSLPYGDQRLRIARLSPTPRFSSWMNPQPDEPL